MEQLLLSDSEGRRVRVGLWQSRTAERVWHAEIELEHDGEWLALDLVALEDLGQDGISLDDGGGLTLIGTAIVDDEPSDGPDSTLPASEVERLLVWASAQLQIRPRKLLRPSALAERLAA